MNMVTQSDVTNNNLAAVTLQGKHITVFIWNSIAVWYHLMDKK